MGPDIVLTAAVFPVFIFLSKGHCFRSEVINLNADTMTSFFLAPFQ